MNRDEKIGLVCVIIAIQLGSTGYLAGILDSEIVFNGTTLILVLFALGAAIGLFLWGDK